MKTSSIFSSNYLNNLKILVADDHSIFRHGLSSLLKNIPFVNKIDEASNGVEVLKALNKTKYDVLFLDIEMPIMNGIDTLQEVKLHSRAPKVIVLSMFSNENYIMDMHDKGMNGYLLKNTTILELKRAIELVMEGEPYYSPEVREILLSSLLKREKAHAFNHNHSLDLSDREVDVLLMICEQYSTFEIAEKLFISEHTVKRHRTSLLEKTGAKNSAGLVVYAVKNNLKKIN